MYAFAATARRRTTRRNDAVLHVTIYGRPARYGHTRDRERVLDVDQFPDRLVPRVRITVGGEAGVRFCGEFGQAWSFTGAAR